MANVANVYFSAATMRTLEELQAKWGISRSATIARALEIAAASESLSRT